MLAFRPQDEATFLASEPTWKTRIGKGWQGARVLGKGSFGVTGLWEYKGDDRNPPAIKQVVVKQTQFQLNGDGRSDGRTPLDEGDIGLSLAPIKALHLVRQYGGNRLGDIFADMEHVVKIFLEYCPGGDLSQFIPGSLEAMKQQPEPLSEMDAWGIFKCLALGILAMDKRTEELFEAGEWNDDEELMHCDLKSDNVFLGFRDKDHARIPIVKIGDFGESMMVPSQELQDDEYGGIFVGRGADDFKPPEETVEWTFGPWGKTGIPVDHPRKGTCSNIWQAGAIMNCLLLQQNLNFNPDRCDDPRDPRTSRSSLAERGTTLATHLNHSIRLETDEIADRYSKTLRLLIQECLLREASMRPSSVQLADATVQGLDATMRGILLLTQRTGRSGLSNLPVNLRNVPIRAPGYLEPEPPTAWLVDHRQWDEAFLPASQPGPKLGGFVTDIASPVAALAGGAVVSGASTAVSTAGSIVSGGLGLLSGYLSSRPGTPDTGTPSDGNTASRLAGYLGWAQRALNPNAGQPGQGHPPARGAQTTFVNFQVDEPGFVVINRD